MDEDVQCLSKTHTDSSLELKSLLKFNNRTSDSTSCALPTSYLMYLDGHCFLMLTDVA